MTTLDFDTGNHEGFHELFDMSVHEGVIVAVDYANDKADVEIMDLGGLFEGVEVYYHCEGQDDVEGGASAFADDDVVYIINNKGKCDPEVADLKIVGFVAGLKPCIAPCLIPNKTAFVTERYYDLHAMALTAKESETGAPFFGAAEAIYNEITTGFPDYQVRRPFQFKTRQAQNKSVYAYVGQGPYSGVGATDDSVIVRIFDYEYEGGGQVYYNRFKGFDVWPQSSEIVKSSLTIADDGKDIWVGLGHKYWKDGGELPDIRTPALQVIHIWWDGDAWNSEVSPYRLLVDYDPWIASLTIWERDRYWNDWAIFAFANDMDWGIYYARNEGWGSVGRLNTNTGVFTNFLDVGGRYLMDWDSTADCLRVMATPGLSVDIPETIHNRWPQPCVFFRQGYAKDYDDYSYNGFCGNFMKALSYGDGKIKSFKMVYFHDLQEVDAGTIADMIGDPSLGLGLAVSVGGVFCSDTGRSDYEYIAANSVSCKTYYEEVNGLSLMRKPATGALEFVDLVSAYDAEGHGAEVAPMLTLEAFKC